MSSLQHEKCVGDLKSTRDIVKLQYKSRCKFHLINQLCKVKLHLNPLSDNNVEEVSSQ